MGRIDIAIRHSAGSLEVNITATNSEVLRQLQTVSDNLRSDLSQRQFTEVAVTVAPAPKNNAAPFGDPQQGRGRQQGREQEDQQPGRALAEANDNPSGFSLA
jgi:flagellar hook-length control protein FliK